MGGGGARGRQKMWNASGLKRMEMARERFGKWGGTKCRRKKKKMRRDSGKLPSHSKKHKGGQQNSLGRGRYRSVVHTPKKKSRNSSQRKDFAKNLKHCKREVIKRVGEGKKSRGKEPTPKGRPHGGAVLKN